MYVTVNRATFDLEGVDRVSSRRKEDDAVGGGGGGDWETGKIKAEKSRSERR